MRFVIRLLGAELLAVDVGRGRLDDEPNAGVKAGAGGQFEQSYGFASARDRMDIEGRAVKGGGRE